MGLQRKRNIFIDRTTGRLRNPGYTCKIVIEDTHPPVWRRVIIPDQITFFELHKINIEKYEPDYKERYPKLVKYKGDNFMEDSGGVWNWEMNEEVSPFDREFVESQFRQMVFPKHKQKDEVKVFNEQDKIDILKGFLTK